MLIIYDTEDCNPTDHPQPFLQRQVVRMNYVRTDAFDKAEMQKWVNKDAVPTKNNKNWVYNHYVPHSRICKAIENYIQVQFMTREIAIKWLINVTYKLGIVPDSKLQSIDWEVSRASYDLWADWAVSAICDWKKNIFYGPGTGDQRGTALDVPDDPTQLARVKAAAIQLALQIPDPNLLDNKIPTEPLVGDEDADPWVRLVLATKENQEYLREFLKTNQSIEEDAGEGEWEIDLNDPEAMFSIETKDWKRGNELRITRDPLFKKGSGEPPYLKARGKKPTKDKKKKPK